MSGTLYSTPFAPIRNSSAPAFNIGATSSGIIALEATGTREWAYPSGRTVRLASIAGDDFFVLFSSDTALAIGSTNGMLVLGGTVELFRVQPAQTHMAFKSSTDVTINVTLGTGQ